MSIVSNVTSIAPFDPTAGAGAQYRSGITLQPNTGIDPLANKSTFLQLLVAQIRNQNPLNPTDGTQFVTQLAQFSQLEQSLSMAQDLSAIRKDLDNGATGATPSPGSPTP